MKSPRSKPAASRKAEHLHVDTSHPSPAAASQVAKATFRSSFTKSPRPSLFGSAPPIAKQMTEISDKEYFRLLKKTDVLGHLLRVNDDLVEAEGLLEVAEVDNTKLDTMNKHILVELQVTDGKYKEAQRLFMDHVQDLTKICLHEEALQKGHTESAAAEYARDYATARITEEAQNLTELKRLTSLEIPANVLAKIASHRNQQMKNVFQSYRRDLRHAEQVISVEQAKSAKAQATDIMHVDKVEGALRSARAEKDNLMEELHLRAKQNEALQTEIAALKEQLETKTNYERECKAAISQHEAAILQSLRNLKADLKKRYGFVPPAVEEIALQTLILPPPPPSLCR
ncbi:hypothetical protein LEN26_019349 [Aphanomyces euteiches]|nr:hypothetical protein LEN26_019349 [Aphanomyces euteiches]